MTTPKIEAATGLHVIPHVAPMARLNNATTRPPTKPRPPKTKYRPLPLITLLICHRMRVVQLLEHGSRWKRSPGERASPTRFERVRLLLS